MEKCKQRANDLKIFDSCQSNNGSSDPNLKCPLSPSLIKILKFRKMGGVVESCCGSFQRV